MITTNLSPARQIELSQKYLPSFDASFVLDVSDDIEYLVDRQLSHSLKTLVNLLFEALDNADKGVTQDIKGS